MWQAADANATAKEAKQDSREAAAEAKREAVAEAPVVKKEAEEATVCMQ